MTEQNNILFLHSAATLQNPFNTTEQVLEWIKEQNKKILVDVQQIPFQQMQPMWQFDSDGNLLLTMTTANGASPSGYKVYIISPEGEVITAIGAGTKSGNFAALKDGAAAQATFGSNMNGLVYGPDGAIYMLDDYTIRKIVKGPSGWSDAVVMTILGGGNSYLDSVGALCLITQTPQDLIFDPENSKVFYFFDWRYTLRKVTITE